jgi:hypothetical protein
MMIRNMVDNMVNPYIASTAPPQGADRVNSMITILRILLYVFPLFPVLGIYMAWTLSWFALGRVPVEYRDYPENFGIIFFAWFGALAFLSAPFFVPCGFLVAACTPFGWCSMSNASTAQRFASLAVFSAVVAAASLILYYDPYRVRSWFFD